MALQTDGLKLFLSQVEYLSCLVCFSWLSQYMSLIPISVWCRDLDLLVMALGGGSVLEMVLTLYLTWSNDNTSPSSSLVTTRGEILARIFDIKSQGTSSWVYNISGVRNLVMEKRIRLEQSCAFPEWVRLFLIDISITIIIVVIIM